MKTIAALQAWNNFSEYYAGKVGELVKDKYEMTITYNQEIDYLNKFDVIWSFFAQRVKDQELLKKTVKTYWEPHEMQDYGKVSVGCSLYTYNILKRDNINVIHAPLGVDEKDFFPQPWEKHDKLVVGWCGLTNNDRKQFKQLKEIFDSFPEVEFKPNLVSGVNDYDKGEYKKVRDMKDYYQKIDVYVCASGREGFGLPLLEASACGRPVITFNVGIAPELKEQGAGIIIVNNFQEMKTQLLNLSFQKDNLKELGERSSQTVKKYWLWSNFKETWLKVFDSI